MKKKGTKKSHADKEPQGLILPDGTPLTAPSESDASPPEVKETEKEITPVDKICQIISAEDEELLSKIEAELEALRKAVQEREEFLNLLQRTQADFLNYQKRIRREKEYWEKYQDESILKELLPALDNLDHSLQVKCESEDAKCILDGVDLTRREILRILEKRGVKPIKTINEKFDPALHEAMGTIESAEHPEGIILEEARPGFILYDRVVRVAQVRVSTPPKTKTPSEEPLEGKDSREGSHG